jgi:hypothetical protein
MQLLFHRSVLLLLFHSGHAKIHNVFKITN